MLRDMDRLVQRMHPNAVNIFLLMSGSFNPIHRSHTRTLLAALQLLREHFAPRNHTSEAPVASSGAPKRDQRFHVAAGVIVPSSDSYVRHKLGPREALPLHFRCSLAEQSLHDEEFESKSGEIFVASYGHADGGYCCELLLADIRQQLRLSSALNSVVGADVRVVQLYGSDFMVRYPGVVRVPMVIVARDDEEGSAQRCVEIMRSQAHRLHPEFLFLTSNGAIHRTALEALPQDAIVKPIPGVGCCSSTRVRELLSFLRARLLPDGRFNPDEEEAVRLHLGMLDSIISRCVSAALLSNPPS